MDPRELLDAALGRLGQGHAIARAAHVMNLRWANSALTTNGDTQTLGLTAIAIRPDGERARVGVVSGQVASAEDAEALAERAVTTCEAAPAGDAAQLLDCGVSPDFDQPPAAVPADLSGPVFGAVDQVLADHNRQFGYAELDTTTTYLASHTGSRYRHVQNSVRFEMSARDDQGSTWWGTNEPPAQVDLVLAGQTRALALQADRKPLAPGRHRVLLSASAVADLLIYLAWSANGRDAVEGHNVFSAPDGGTKIGQRLSDRDITLYADPRFPGLQCAERAVIDVNGSMESVFDNGLELARQDLIREGRLTALRIGRPAARSVGLPPVYLADNLILQDAAGHGSPADLIARTEDAVLITCLWYIREVDPQNLLLTGLTRDGVYRVRNGEIVEALPNFRFNVSVPELLAHIVDSSESGPTLPREWADWFTRTSMPSMVVDGFNLSSPSEAL